MSLPVVQADLENRIGAAEVARFSGSSSTRVDEAIAEAWSKARSAALNVWTAASWDAMTAGTLPAEAKSHIVSDAVDLLSSGKGRPSDIDAKSKEAAMWRGWLAGDKVRSFDAILVRVNTTGAIGSRMGEPSGGSFNPDNSNSRYGDIFPEF